MCRGQHGSLWEEEGLGPGIKRVGGRKQSRKRGAADAGGGGPCAQAAGAPELWPGPVFRRHPRIRTGEDTPSPGRWTRALGIHLGSGKPRGAGGLRPPGPARAFRAEPAGANSQCVKLRQGLERRPSHRLDGVIIKVPGRETHAEVGDAALPARPQQAPLCFSPGRPKGAPTPLQHGPEEQDSHCLQQRVPREGLFWDGLDVVVMETPVTQARGQ